MERVIWQYWETRAHKPKFIDGLRGIVERNAGAPVQLVTPDNITEFLPDLPNDIHRIHELAHKADMIRTMLLKTYGGMWLDSDAIVLKDLGFLFDLLEEYDFVGFNDNGQLKKNRNVFLRRIAPLVRVNCFLARREGVVVSDWVEKQHQKFPRTRFGWTEIGSELLHPICLKNKDIVKILDFKMICPIPWSDVEKFEHSNVPPASVFDDEIVMVMMSNKAMQDKGLDFENFSVEQIAQKDVLLGRIMRMALRYADV